MKNYAAKKNTAAKKKTAKKKSTKATQAKKSSAKKEPKTTIDKEGVNNSTDDTQILNESKNLEDKEKDVNNEADSVKDEPKHNDEQDTDTDKRPEQQDPLNEAEPIRKGYNEPEIVGDIENIPDIPEEKIERPTIDLSNSSDSEASDFIDESKEKKHDGQEEAPDDKHYDEYETVIDRPGTGKEDKSEYSQMSNKEKDESSRYVAETILDGYEMAHTITLSVLSQDGEKLKKKAVKGKIDMRAVDSEIQIGERVYSIRELIDDYNNNLASTLTVSDEFKEKALPLLQEELKRRDIGMTPLQRLAALTLKDLQPKIVQISQLTGTMNSILKQQSKIIKNMDNKAKEKAKDKETVVVDDTKMEPEEKENKKQDTNIDEEIDKDNG